MVGGSSSRLSSGPANANANVKWHCSLQNAHMSDPDSPRLKVDDMQNASVGLPAAFPLFPPYIQLDNSLTGGSEFG